MPKIRLKTHCNAWVRYSEKLVKTKKKSRMKNWTFFILNLIEFKIYTQEENIMTTNLPAQNHSLLPCNTEFQMFQTIANSAKKSGLYGGDENKIFMVLLAARELAIPPMLALNGGIWNIQGKIEISARLMNSMIRRAGHKMSITSTDKECIIVGKRADTGEEHTEKFTWAMAEKAGLTTGNVWKKYPEDMLYNRCMSRLARRLFPDVIGTAYVEGEIREAIEAEKSLQQAEYQDITKPVEAPITVVIESPLELKEIQNEEPKFTEEQINEISQSLQETTPEFKVKLKENMQKYWGATEFINLPQKAYKNIVVWINNNLEMQRQMSKEESVAHA